MYFTANTKQHLEKKQAKESDYTKKMNSTHLTYTQWLQGIAQQRGQTATGPQADKTKVTFKAKNEIKIYLTHLSQISSHTRRA